MRVLVCGGREFGNLPDQDDPTWMAKYKEYRFGMDTLTRLSLGWPSSEPDKYGNTLPLVTIISGGAKGADSMAEDWAIVHWCSFKEYKADWNKHGKAAGPIRNQQMLEEGKPDLVVAFPGGRGTADMVKRAREAGVKVIEVEVP